MDYFSQQSVESNVSPQQLQKKYLTFVLGDKLYAISVLKIKEILEYETITPIPRMPKFICGAINLRGQIIPIVDLMEQLDIGEHTLSSRSCIVVIMVNHDGNTITAGILVDSVSRVIDFDDADIDKAPDLGGQLNTEFIEGMGKSGDDFMIILNIDRVFSLEEIISLTGVEQHETDQEFDDADGFSDSGREEDSLNANNTQRTDPDLANKNVPVENSSKDFVKDIPVEENDAANKSETNENDGIDEENKG